MEFNCSRRLMLGGDHVWVLGAALILMLSPVRAWPWGCEGHQAVAMIAEKHMTAHALEKANKLLQSEPIDPALSRYCTSQGLDLMADSATWADNVRSLRPETSPWHFIDISRGAQRSTLAEFCPASTGCVTGAIEHQVELLRANETDARVRADALRFVIHLVGDLHQPLHCVSNNDMGGNCVPVDFFGNAPVVGSTDPVATGPFTHKATVLRHSLPCSPCFKRTCDQNLCLSCRHRRGGGKGCGEPLAGGEFMSNAAVFLDRDGTINEEMGYINHIRRRRRTS